MWRVVEDVNHITGKSVWVIEKRVGLLLKRWSRNYPVGNSNMFSPIKSLNRDSALHRMQVLSSGVVLQSGEVINS